VFRHLPTGDVITEMSHTRKNKKLCILYFSWASNHFTSATNTTTSRLN
jgi:hypothetical protein